MWEGVALVVIVHFQDNIRSIVFGSPQGNLGLAITIAVVAMLVAIAIRVWASWQTLRAPG